MSIKPITRLYTLLALSVVLISHAMAAEPAATEQFPALTRVYRMMAAGKRVNIAFLGGSITWGACASDPMKTSYRALVSAQLEADFPAAHLRFIDAAIGGNPSKLAVFRMDRDLLPQKPDLVFVEFAVNDFEAADSQETMEGIVRKLHNTCPSAAVVILVIGSTWDYHTPAMEKHLELAKYYGLPCINICSAVQRQMKQGLDIHTILFDGCHPNDRGYRIYADIILSQLAALRDQGSAATPFPPQPLTANRYESAAMLELSHLKDLGGWRHDVPSNVGTWFDQQPSRWQSSCIAADKDEAAIDFDLECSTLGLYYETAEGSGAIRLQADDVTLLDIPTTMKFPFARVDFKVAAPAKLARRHIRLTAHDISKGVRAAYLLYCR